MRIEAQPAFVLHARPWRETSLIVELLTRDHGRVAVIARGVQGAKRHPLRAALQPLQWLRVDFLPRGELARLIQAEALDAAPMLQGEALMAAFYLNELLLRLLPRQDPAPALFERWRDLQEDPDGVEPSLGAADPSAVVTGEQTDLSVRLQATTVLPGEVFKHRLRLLAGSHWELRDVTSA